MASEDVCESVDADRNLVRHDLGVAEEDGALALLGSVFSRENDVVYDGIDRPGPRLVTFAHILKSEVFPLADILKFLLETGRHGMACPIEIEFAANTATKPMQFGVLQIRPTVADETLDQAAVLEVEQDKLICRTSQAMGNGSIRDVRDIVFVKPACFAASKTRIIARQLGQLNETLRKAGRSSILIGPGRWGSSDAWLGIPVTWDQISTARVVVETSLRDFVVTPSQGSHFFQNLTSFRIGYLTVNPTAGGGFIDWDWLNRQPPEAETEFLRHVCLEFPAEVHLDGRTRRGVILKPNTTGDSRNTEPSS
jgi:hypothetical protein